MNLQTVSGELKRLEALVTLALARARAVAGAVLSVGATDPITATAGAHPVIGIRPGVRGLSNPAASTNVPAAAPGVVMTAPAYAQVALALVHISGVLQLQNTVGSVRTVAVALAVGGVGRGDVPGFTVALAANASVCVPFDFQDVPGPGPTVYQINARDQTPGAADTDVVVPQAGGSSSSCVNVEPWI